MPNFLISRWRRKQKSAGATWLNANGDLVLGISWIVKAEFLCGAEIAGHDREAINHFLMRFPTVWPVHETLEVYASLYAALKKRNQLIPSIQNIWTQ